MVHKCCISSCGMSVRVIGTKGLSYHAFPIKEPSREKWLQAVLPHVEKPETFKIVQAYTRICSRHFKKKDYSIDSRKRARLSSSAVPSGFPGRDIREACQPTRVERIPIENSAKTPTLTINSAEQNSSPKEFASRNTTKNVTIESLPTLFDLSGGSLTDQPSQPLSEDDTASSTFSSQEECHISRPQANTTKSNGKVRKRRKHRASLPLPLNSSKKRSSAAEDLNIEGVGDALAEINLSAFISPSSDLIHGTKPRNRNLTTVSDGIKVEPIFLHPTDVKPHLIKSSNIQRSLPLPSDEKDSFTFFVYPKTEISSQPSVEHDLLISIKAVSIGPNDTPDPQSPARPTTPSREIDSATLNDLISSTSDESLVSRHLHDLYADLVNEGASLSLEDSTGTIFDSQLLIDALQGVAEDLEQGGASIDQLARDLGDSFLNDALTPPCMAEINQISVEDLVPFRTQTVADFHSTFDAPLPQEEIIVKCTNTEEKPENGKDATIVTSYSEHESPNKRIKEESESSPECDDLCTPTRSRKKSSKKEKSEGSFSVERFRDSNKDIEYYTGFPTFEKFDAFFTSIESYVENLKVTDMVHGVANLGLSVPTTDETLVTSEGTVEQTSDIGTADEPKRRLSQGRSMSRMDEMFMTIIRLRRKIPEKVIGHMFCISQPSVSRIIRAWTMLLSKILELTTEAKAGSSSKSTQRYSKNVDKSEGTEKSKDAEAHYHIHDDIPSSFRQLFYSELAQGIICSGNAALNSRKTSSSTKCPNISRSKRPKKEKITTTVTEESTVTSQSKDVPSINDDFNIIPMSPLNDQDELSSNDLSTIPAIEAKAIDCN